MRYRTSISIDSKDISMRLGTVMTKGLPSDYVVASIDASGMMEVSVYAMSMSDLACKVEALMLMMRSSGYHGLVIKDLVYETDKEEGK